MPLEKIGLNLNGLQNITAPVYNFKNTSEDFINDIPIKANEITQGYWGLISLGFLFFFLLWKLSQDLENNGSFGYSNTRAIGIASCICSIIGLYGINIGYFTNMYHVVIFIVVSFISVGIVWKSQT